MVVVMNMMVMMSRNGKEENNQMTIMEIGKRPGLRRRLWFALILTLDGGRSCKRREVVAKIQQRVDTSRGLLLFPRLQTDRLDRIEQG